MSDGSKDFALGLIIGGLIGAAVALLYAPMAGEDTRRRVGEKLGGLADEAKGKATEIAGTARERVGEVATTLRERVEDLRGRVTTAIEAGREAAQEKQEELGQRVEETSAPVINPETA